MDNEIESGQKSFSIPHNFDNNGRVLNLIEKEACRKLLFAEIPLAVLIYLLPLGIDDKMFLEVLLGGAVFMLFAFNLDVRLMDYLQYNANKKIYYNYHGDYEEREERGNVEIEGLYEFYQKRKNIEKNK